jgi:hypothetical protein
MERMFLPMVPSFIRYGAPFKINTLELTCPLFGDEAIAGYHAEAGYGLSRSGKGD